MKDPIGFGRRRAVRGLGDDFRLYPRRVVLADLVLDRSRDEDVAVELQELRVRDPYRAREAGERTGLALVRVHAIRVDTLRVHDRACRIREPDDHGPELSHQLRREATGVSESLHDDACALEVHAQVLRRLDDRVHRATCRRLVAAFASTDRERLAGHHGKRRVAVVHGVRVHDPGHRLRVRVHIGRRDVAVGADQELDLGRVAAGKRLELLRAHRLRIAHHATLRAAVGDPNDRALPGHPHRERFDLVERYRGVIADAAFARSARGVVLHAVAGEDLHHAVRHPHREVDRELALGRAEDPSHVWIEMELVRRDAELFKRDLPRIALGVVDDRRRCLHEFLRGLMGSPSVSRSRANRCSSFQERTRCSSS